MGTMATLSFLPGLTALSAFRLFTKTRKPLNYHKPKNIGLLARFLRLFQPCRRIVQKAVRRGTTFFRAIMARAFRKVGHSIRKASDRIDLHLRMVLLWFVARSAIAATLALLEPIRGM